MAFECKYCDRPTGNGTGKSAHERHCAKNPDRPLTLTDQRAAERAANPDNRCPECEAEGEGRGFDNPGALASHRVKTHGVPPRKPKKKGEVATVVDNAVAVNGNGHSPAQIRRSLRHQARDRDDLVAIVRVVFPEGIETRNPNDLDSSLSYVFQTASMLERRP